jgi:hypothetical protein
MSNLLSWLSMHVFGSRAVILVRTASLGVTRDDKVEDKVDSIAPLAQIDPELQSSACTYM